MTTKVWIDAEGVEIELDEAAVAEQARAFRESLRAFGLDRYMIGDAPEKVFTLQDGRVVAEFRTMLLPVWRQEDLNKLVAAGFDVVIFTKHYKKHPPQLMYYVRSVREILGGNYGN